MPQKLKIIIIQKLHDVPLSPRKKVIGADYLISFFYQPLT